MSNHAPKPGASAEVIRLDGAGHIYGVASTGGAARLSWTIFIGQDAGREAYVYADAHFLDVKTGRGGVHSAPPLGLAS